MAIDISVITLSFDNKPYTEAFVKSIRKYTKSIMANATDQTLATIAQKVLEAKEQGRDYFDEVKKGIMSMDIPSDDSHSDSHH